VVVFGKSGVGKTSLLSCFAKGKPSEYTLNKTIGVDFFWKDFENGNFRFEFWDTPGDQRLHPFFPVLVRGAHFFLFVYDVTDASSLSEFNQFYLPKVKETKKQIEFKRDVPWVFIGNKNDEIHKKCVPIQDVKQLLEKYEIKADIYEVSAKTAENVLETLDKLVKTI
jgi:small GTP-binding protein